MATHPVPTAELDTAPRTDTDLALRIALGSLLGWYRRDGRIPAETVQRLLADPVAADRALRWSTTDPLTVLRQAVPLPILTDPGCRCTDDYECDSTGGDPQSGGTS